MTRRSGIVMGLWALLALAALIWLLAGNLSSEFGVFAAMFVAVSFAYIPARLIALRRSAKESPLEPRIVPLRVGYGITGAITFGPAIAAIFDWVPILPALGSFLGGFVLMTWVTAALSDGYQGLWLDSLIFHGNLTPPEDDWINQKR
ncbi:hypothetical protein [Saccharopolyspora griseoalba]|uniref:Uncharacterized protein n=1 Tax=Saccharopolyspora griseoalba TaxID=1431848 RepID=A0ABW2LHP2_9PSEU